MIRALILFEYPTLNGGEQSMLAVIDAWTEQGEPLEVVAVAPAKGRLADELNERGLEHVAFDVRDGQGARRDRAELLAELAAVIRQAGTDLVHANSLSMGRLLGALGDDFGIPRTAHLRDIVSLSNAAIDDLSRNDVLIAVSGATRRFHVDQGVDPDRVGVVYNGVDCEIFHPWESTGTLKQELDLGDDAFLVGTIGQIGLRKGLEVLASAAAILAPDHPEMHFILIGERNSEKAESIEYEQRIVAMFEEAGLSGRLHRLGYRDDVPELMNDLDLLVHAAHQEPFGRVLLEAAASGLPIVATDVGGTAEMLVDGESATLVPPGDPQALAKAVGEVSTDEKLRERLGAAARERVQTLFPVGRAARALLEVWRVAAS